MFQTILFDLDNTLLGDAAGEFIPAYFEALSNHLAPTIGKSLALQGLMAASEAMDADVQTAVSNHDIFWQVFKRVTGYDQEMEAPLFYRDIYPQLESFTQKRPVARELMTYCFAQGWKVAIATKPVFPLVAIRERLRWAGVPMNDFDYARVTTYENSTAVKPHLFYYQQILQEIGSVPADALMVGDSWEMDIEPAAALGMSAYWINDHAAPPDSDLVVGYGTLDDFFTYLQQL